MFLSAESQSERKWSLARSEEVTQEQVECKKSLASAVAKHVKLQDEVNYLIDMIGVVPQSVHGQRTIPPDGIAGTTIRYEHFSCLYE
ncbi:hypothetical protein CF319_g8692 [Tilletia indica]|uniref:Uncharacterized protein n=1 Tax=Tilletia indica TaxID=43049 RepID=A0A177TE45_9BASI|nr:hypothetical protein CF326_g9778 [Tilletia indica]KAE8217154.1 hypothetical protein CF319_g8692 [Tilletia indica]KAE8241858.1 hypothetical protein A4X13_0g7229 [Tilletia indica]